MTAIMPKDEAHRLLDNVVGITPDALPLMQRLLSSVIAAHDEIERLRADAQAAVAELAELRALCQDKCGPGGDQTSTGP